MHGESNMHARYTTRTVNTIKIFFFMFVISISSFSFHHLLFPYSARFLLLFIVSNTSYHNLV
nr:MAG TPA: hypothetical protein [Caudoviricetes sp.]